MMFRRPAPFPAWKEELMHEMAAFGDRARGAMAAVAVGNPLGVRQEGRGRGRVARRRRYRANRRHRRGRSGRIAGDRGPRLGRGRGSGRRARGYGYRPDAPESVRGTVEEAEGTPLHSLVTDVRNRKGYTLLTPKARLAEYRCAAGRQGSAADGRRGRRRHRRRSRRRGRGSRIRPEGNTLGTARPRSRNRRWADADGGTTQTACSGPSAGNEDFGEEGAQPGPAAPAYQFSMSGRSSTLNDHAERSWWAMWNASSAIADGLQKNSSGLSAATTGRVRGVSMAASTRM